MEEFQVFFYVIEWTRLLRSILVLLFSEVVAHFVDNGSGMYCAGFAGIYAPRAVFPSVVHSWHGEVCTVDASPSEQVLLGNLDNISVSPLHIADIFSSRHVAPVDFWEPSTTKRSSLSRARGGGGVAGSLDPR